MGKLIDGSQIQNINGSRQQDNLITVDGAVATRTRGNNSTLGVADTDAVQEVRIVTANYNAEYGRASGGQIRLRSKTRTGSTTLFHPGFQNWNPAAMKNFRLREHHTLQFRAEFFNWPLQLERRHHQPAQRRLRPCQLQIERTQRSAQPAP